MSLPEPEPRRARHLMDPSRPRPATTPEDLARLRQVQRWVVSVLAGTTILHLSAGLVIAATFIDESDPVPRIALCIVAGAFGICAVGAFLAIHGRSLASPWLALGLVPTLVGLLLVLG